MEDSDPDEQDAQEFKAESQALKEQKLLYEILVRDWTQRKQYEIENNEKRLQRQRQLRHRQQQRQNQRREQYHLQDWQEQMWRELRWQEQHWQRNQEYHRLTEMQEKQRHRFQSVASQFLIERALNSDSVVVMTDCSLHPLEHAAFNFVYYKGLGVPNLFREPELSERLVWQNAVAAIEQEFVTPTADSADCLVSLSPIAGMTNEQKTLVMCELLKRRMLRRRLPIIGPKMYRRLTRELAKCQKQGIFGDSVNLASMSETQKEAVNGVVSALAQLPAGDCSLIAHVARLCAEAEDACDDVAVCFFGVRPGRRPEPRGARQLLRLLVDCRRLMAEPDTECARLRQKHLGVSLQLLMPRMRMPHFLLRCLRSIAAAGLRRPPQPLSLSAGVAEAEMLAINVDYCGRIDESSPTMPESAYQIVKIFLRQLPDPLLPDSLLAEADVVVNFDVDCLLRLVGPRQRLLLENLSAAVHRCAGESKDAGDCLTLEHFVDDLTPLLCQTGSRRVRQAKQIVADLFERGAQFKMAANEEEEEVEAAASALKHQLAVKLKYERHKFVKPPWPD